MSKRGNQIKKIQRVKGKKGEVSAIIKFELYATSNSKYNCILLGKLFNTDLFCLDLSCKAVSVLR